MLPCYSGCLTAPSTRWQGAPPGSGDPRPRTKASTQLASVHSLLVNTGKSWALYIVLRIVFFAVPFGVLLLINWPWWLALLVATLIALALSVIFLSKQRGEASTSIYEWRNRDRTADDIVEDELVEDAIADEVTTADSAHEGSAAKDTDR